MALHKLRLSAQIFSFLVPYAFTFLGQRISAFIHKFQYRSLPASQTKKVVVIGGSFAGIQLIKRLSESLPTGYCIVLIEKNSHFNYVFAFPRFNVVKGYEKLGFIPYIGITKGAPRGIVEHLRDEAVKLTNRHVVLKSGEKIEFAYLVIATGTSSSLASKVASPNHIEGQAELRSMQDRIADAQRIAVIGGGAVGVELASDIKDVHPGKDVVLIHSRAHLLPGFGKRLHDHVIGVFEEMGISVLLNERPRLPIQGRGMLELLNGKLENFDLVQTLQIADEEHPNVFAIGDVAETGGPKMARASFFQTEVILHNILSLIAEKRNLKRYKPILWIEGSIKLTLGTGLPCPKFEI
ncbi:hypothetical protein BDV96DRAFT_664054, partial [Lophiotrema nucula]